MHVVFNIIQWRMLSFIINKNTYLLHMVHTCKITRKKTLACLKKVLLGDYIAKIFSWEGGGEYVQTHAHFSLFYVCRSDFESPFVLFYGVKEQKCLFLSLCYYLLTPRSLLGMFNILPETFALPFQENLF